MQFVTLVECSSIFNVYVVFCKDIHFAKSTRFHYFVDSCIAIRIDCVLFQVVEVL